jgi:uncharacterized protein (TIGR02452 family)
MNMIKKNGVALMNARTNNVAIGKETLAIVKEGNYLTRSSVIVDFSDDLDKAVKGTILYKDEPHTQVKKTEAKVEVTPETSGQAARRYCEAGKDIVVLNFASARNPGGGFLAGAMAQEEDLCRCSGLYTCIKTKPIFYNENILADNSLYTDNMIYSPKVPFIRDEHLLLLEQPFLVSVITAPAPNVRALDEVDPKDLKEILLRRSIKILRIASAHGHRNIVLGAWGCGAFGNDPEMVSKAFMAALDKVPDFDEVCFAIYENNEEKPFLNIFQKNCLE